MLTVDIANLLWNITPTKLKHNYCMRSFDVHEYLKDESYTIRLYGYSNIYILTWLYNNIPDLDIQLMFDIQLKNGAVKCIKHLCRLNFKTDHSLMYAISSNNLYCVKWVYKNISDKFESDSMCEGDCVDVSILDWLYSIYDFRIIEVESSIQYNDFAAVMWYCDKYGEESVTYEYMAYLAAIYNKIKILRWLINTYPIIEVNNVIIDVYEHCIDNPDEKYNICMLWLVSICPKNTIIDNIDYS